MSVPIEAREEYGRISTAQLPGRGSATLTFRISFVGEGLDVLLEYVLNIIHSVVPVAAWLGDGYTVPGVIFLNYSALVFELFYANLVSTDH